MIAAWLATKDALAEGWALAFALFAGLVVLLFLCAAAYYGYCLFMRAVDALIDWIDALPMERDK